MQPGILKAIIHQQTIRAIGNGVPGCGHTIPTHPARRDPGKQQSLIPDIPARVQSIIHENRYAVPTGTAAVTTRQNMHDPAPRPEALRKVENHCRFSCSPYCHVSAANYGNRCPPARFQTPAHCNLAS
ncbi:hypothetical protein AA21952_1806 [Acetobacter oeni LMG 21952]|nr:hypothetical protein AA21952_1806 [Acetobacter oeni LMG 21952]